MSNLEMYALVVGFLMPLLLAVIIQSHWSSGLKATLAFGACLVAAAGTVYFQQPDWDWHDWIGSSLLVLVTAIASYKGVWKPTGISDGIETNTNVVTPSP